MGMLFCCIFFVRCRHRNPEALELMPRGPKFAWVCRWLPACTTHPWLQHGVLLRIVLTVHHGVEGGAFRPAHAVVCEQGRAVPALLVDGVF